MWLENLINGVPLILALQIVLVAVPKGEGVRWGGLGLAAVVTGLIWESVDEWMPPDLEPRITKSFMGVMAVASCAVLMSRRESDIARASVAAPGAIGLTCVILISDLGKYRSMTIACAALLALVAGLACGHQVFARSSFGRRPVDVRASADLLWRFGTSWAVALVMSAVGLIYEPMASWAVVLLQTALVGAAIATLLLGEVILLMWRYPAFGTAYAISTSTTREYVRLRLFGCVALLPLVLTVPGILWTLHASPEWVRLMASTGGLLVAHRLFLAMKQIRDQAVRLQRRILIGVTGGEVRGLAEANPVYRLLPGLPRKPL